MMARLSWYLDPLSPLHLKMFIKQEVKFGPPMTNRSVSARVKDCAILEPYVQTESPLEFYPRCKIRIRERSDLMVECLTRGLRVTGSSLSCDTAAVCVLEQDTLISSKYCFKFSTQEDQPDMTQRRKESIQINKIRLTHTQRRTEIIFMTHFIAKLNCRFYCLNWR